MPTVYIYPVSIAAGAGNVASGAVTDIDDGIIGGTPNDTSRMITNQNSWPSSTTIDFNLGDLPAEATAVTAVALRARADMVGNKDFDDTNTVVFSLVGTGAPTGGTSVSYANTVEGGTTFSAVQKTRTYTGGFPTVSQFNALLLRLTQTHSQTMGADGTALQISEIELEVVYTAAANNISQIPQTSLTVTANAPQAVTTQRNVSQVATSAAISVTANAPTIVTSEHQYSQLPSATITVTPNVPLAVSTASQTSQLPGIEFTISANTPTFEATEHHLSQPPDAAIVVAANAPQVVNTEHNYSQLVSASVSLTANAPQAVSVEANTAQIPQASITLTNNAPSAVTSENNFSQFTSASLSVTVAVPSAVTTENQAPGSGGQLYFPVTQGWDRKPDHKVLLNPDYQYNKELLFALNFGGEGEASGGVAGYDLVDGRSAWEVAGGGMSAERGLREQGGNKIDVNDSSGTRMTGIVPTRMADGSAGQSTGVLVVAALCAEKDSEVTWSPVLVLRSQLQGTANKISLYHHYGSTSQRPGAYYENQGITCATLDASGGPVTDDDNNLVWKIWMLPVGAVSISGFRVFHEEWGLYSNYDATGNTVQHDLTYVCVASDTDYTEYWKGDISMAVGWKFDSMSSGEFLDFCQNFVANPWELFEPEQSYYLIGSTPPAQGSLFFPVTEEPEVEYVGRNVQDPDSFPMSSDRGLIQEFEFPGGLLDEAFAYFDPTSAAGDQVRVIIYSADEAAGGEPQALVAFSDLVSVPAGGGLIRFGKINAELSAGRYFLGVTSSSFNSRISEDINLSGQNVKMENGNVNYQFPPRVWPTTTSTYTDIMLNVWVTFKSLDRWYVIGSAAPPAGESNISELASASITVTANAPQAATTEQHIAQLASASITVTGNAPQATATEANIAQLASASVTVTGNTPQAVTTEANVSELASATLTLTPNTPQAVSTAGNYSQIPSASITVTANAPDATTTERHISQLASAALSVTPNAPSAVTQESNVSALSAATIGVTAQNPEAVTSEGNYVVLPSAAIALSANAPQAATTEHHISELASANIAVTANAPDAVATENNYSQLAQASLTLVVGIPQAFVTEGTDADVSQLPSATLTLTPNAPQAVTTEAAANNISQLASASITVAAQAPQAATTEHHISELAQASLTLTPNAPIAVATEHRISQMPSVSITLSANAPATVVSENHYAQLASASLTLTPNAPQAISTQGEVVLLPTASVVVTGNAVGTETTERNIAALPSASVTIVGNAPTIVVFDPHTVQMGTAVLTVAAQAPQGVTSESHIAQLASAALTVAAQAPNAATSESHVIVMASASITVTAIAPTVFVPGNELAGYADPDVIDLSVIREFILIR